MRLDEAKQILNKNGYILEDKYMDDLDNELDDIIKTNAVKEEPVKKPRKPRELRQLTPKYKKIYSFLKEKYPNCRFKENLKPSLIELKNILNSFDVKKVTKTIKLSDVKGIVKYIEVFDGRMITDNCRRIYVIISQEQGIGIYDTYLENHNPPKCIQPVSDLDNLIKQYDNYHHCSFGSGPSDWALLTNGL